MIDNEPKNDNLKPLKMDEITDPEFVKNLADLRESLRKFSIWLKVDIEENNKIINQNNKLEK